MMIQKWHTLAVLSNLAFFVMMVVFLFVTQRDFAGYDYSDYLLVLLIREGIILLVQIGWNLLLYAIPRFFLHPESKEPK